MILAYKIEDNITIFEEKNPDKDIIISELESISHYEYFDVVDLGEHPESGEMYEIYAADEVDEYDELVDGISIGYLYVGNGRLDLEEE